MSIILGIDPGLNNAGWGVIKSRGNEIKYIACGSIKTNPKDDLATRLAKLSKDLKKIIESYNIDTAAIEETFVNKNAGSSLKLGHARGALMLTVSLAELEIKEYAAREVKKCVVGVGKAEKEQVAMMVKVLLPGCEIENYDAADALAVAICHSQNMNFAKNISEGIPA